MLDGKIALVSGATRGIGRATALALARNGAALVLNATSEAGLADLAREIEAAGGRTAIAAGDVADPQTADKAVRAAIDAFGTIDILVNNAGINHRSPTLAMPLEAWQRVIDVNLNGTLHFCRAVLPVMIEAGGGRIVNVSSTNAKTAHRNAAPAYGASKAAVNYLTMHLALEMAPHGIVVNAVCPGPVETDMTGQWSDEYRRGVLASMPMGRIAKPEAIADAILFLASPMADFISGETINVNGGSYTN